MVDNTAPTVAITGVPGMSTAPFTATFTFSEDVTGFTVDDTFTEDDIEVGNGAASAFTATTAGTVFTALITPAAAGTVTVDVAADAATDEAGNGSTAAAQATSIYTVTDPCATSVTDQVWCGAVTMNTDASDTEGFGYIAAAHPESASFGSLSDDDFEFDGTTYTVWRVTYDTSRTEFDWTFAVATGGTLTEFPAANLSELSVRFSDFSDPTTTATAELSAATYSAGNGYRWVPLAKPSGFNSWGIGDTAAVRLIRTVAADTTAPRVMSVERQDPGSSPTNADSLTWRVAFTENVKNVDAADFAIAGTTATVTDVTEATASTVYDVTASGGNLASLDATVTLSFASGWNIADNADNALSNPAPTGTNDNTWVVDNTAPTVTITGVPGTSSVAFTATFTFTEAVTGFVAGDITLGNATASNFMVTSTTVYTALITPTANGAVTVDVAAAVALDAAGNGNTAAARASSTYTMPVPTITIAAGTTPVTEGASAAFTLTRSGGPPGNPELMVNVSVTETEDMVAAADKGAKTVTFQANSATAMLGVATVADSVDETDSVVTATVTANPATYTVGTSSSATVTVTDDDTRGVTVSALTLDVNEGSSGTYTVVLDSEPTASVTVTPSSGNSDVTVSSALTFTTMNWSTAQMVTVTAAHDSDAVDDSATISHAVAGGDYGAVTATSVTVTVDDDETADTTAPRVASIVRGTPSSSPTNADSLTWRVTFSEAVSNVDTADFAVSGTTATLSVSAVSGVTGAYDVTASGGNLAGVTATVTLSIAAGHNIQDAASNALTNTTPTGANDNTYVVDNTAPTVTITGVPGTSSAAFTATFTFSEAVTGFVVGDITLGNATASSFTVTSTTVYTALITPTANGAVTVDVAADAATDAAGNGNTAAARASSTYTMPVPTITIAAGTTPVTEGASAAFTLTRSGGPPGNPELTVNVSVTETEDMVAAADKGAKTVTFQANSATAMLGVATVADSVDETDSVVTATVTANPATYTVGTSSSATVTVTDDDTRGVTVSAPMLDVNEGSSGTYTVVLDSEPTASVTVTPSSGNSDVTVSSALTFTTMNWSTAQMVTVTAAHDSDAVDDSATISHAVAGGDYGAVTAASVTVTVDDDETADTTAPRVASIVRGTPSSSPTNADSLTWRVTFSEAVSNVDTADFAVNGTTATLSVSAVSGVTGAYDVTASGGNLAGVTATVTLSIASGHDIQDAASNALTNTTPTGANDNTYVVDNTAPTVTITGVPDTSSAAFTATFTFTEAVTGFVVGDITLGNATASSFMVTSTTVYTALITPTANGAVTVDVAADVATDAAGNGNTAATRATSTYTGPLVDTTAPRVASIVRRIPSSSPTNADSLTWRITFSENVKNVDAADFAIAGTTATVTNVTVVTASTVYDVTASGGSLAGLDATVTLSFAGGQNIADTSDNVLSNTAPTGTNDNTWVVDNTAPTVAITGVPATSTAAFTATFTFSEDVTGFTVNDIDVDNGAASAFTATTADRVYTASITPAVGGTVTVDVAASAARDAAGNGNPAATQASSTYLVDTAPSMPASFTATGGDRQAVLEWTAPASDGGAAIEKYQYRYSAGSTVGTSAAWADVPDADADADLADERSVTVTGLDNGRQYAFELRAVNSVGGGEAASDTATPMAIVTAPGEPESLTARAGDAQVTLSWTPPAFDGGAPIERYQYRHSAGSTVASGARWMDVPDADSDGSFADERSVTVPDLDNARQYAFEVRAVNRAVNGRAARAVAIPVRAPLPPGSGFLVSNFGQTVDGAAQIFVTHNVVGVFTTGARGAELHNIEFRLFSRLPDIAQLPSATLYRASVTDTRAATRGEPVAALTAVPGSPRPAARAQTVAFTAPAGTRLEAGATYMVVLEEIGYVSVESTTFPAEDAGGARGWAVDGIGSGNSSPWSYGTTASLLMRVYGTPDGATVATAPDAPASLGASAGDARVRLIWASPRNDGGAPIEKYQYRYSAGSRVGPGTAWTDVPDADSDGRLADERSVTVGDLDNGREYAFEVRAVNAVRGGAAATATATPAAPPRRGFLVSNFGRPVDGAAQIYVTQDIVGVFTTGAQGADLHSIEFRLFTRRPNIALLPIPSVTLYRASVTDSRATQGERVAALTAVPGTPRSTDTAQTVAFAAPSGTRLEAGATYLVVLEHTSYVGVQYTDASAQDAGGASGWTIDGVGAGNSSPWSYGTSGSLLMRVNGTTAATARPGVREEEEEQEQEQEQEPATTPDPDRGISLSTSSSSAIEGQAVTIGVRRAGPTDRETSVAVQVFDSALTGAWPIDLDLSSGVATATATVPIPFDGARPASRTVTVRLASVEEPYSVGSPSRLTFNVTDRDAALSVHDARVSEGPGATLAFAVTLDRTRDQEVRVKYATSDGTARQGEDYTGVSGTLRFAPGETSKTVSVPVLDDAHDEGTETLVLRLSAVRRAVIEDGEATGSIENSDPMPRAWTVRFGRTVGGQVVDALTERLEGGKRSHLTVAGIPLMGTPATEPEAEADDPFALPAWAGNDVREEEARTLTADDLLLRSTFHLRSGGEGGEGPVFTTWARAVTGRFASEADDVRLDGDVVTGMVGFDAEWERSLAGVMLSRSTGEGSRLDPVAGVGEHGPAGGDSGSIESGRTGDGAGTVESDLTGVYPYARADLTDRVSAWGLAGAGSGTVTLKRAGGRDMKTDISMRMGALGVKGQVLDGSGPSGVAMSVKSDAMWVGTKSARSNDMVGTQGDVTRLRLLVEGERMFIAGNGATFTPSAEVGLRHDAGDAETGAGLEVGAGVRYALGTLLVEGRARGLVAHEASGYEEWGVSGAVRIAPGESGTGLTLSIAPEWGRTGSASQRLWSARDASGLGGSGEFEAESRLTAETGYGFALAHGRGVLTPFGALTLGNAGGHTMRAGARWMLGADLAASLEATRSESRAAEATNELRLRAALRF